MRVVAGGIVLASLALACSDQGPSDSSPPPSPSPFVVSNPVPGPDLSPARGALSRSVAATASVASAASVVYVSLPPGSLPDGTGASIRDRATASRVIAPIVSGGFDPVAVEGAAGDTLDVAVQNGTAPGASYEIVVFAKARPSVVRTSPPDNKRDVSLNGLIVAIFSEPMDSASLVSTVTLSDGSSPVPGRVVIPPNGGDILQATYVPDAPLAQLTTYTLRVGAGARDRDGETLSAPVRSDFTTEDASATPALFDFHVNLPPRLYLGETVLAGAAISPAVGLTQQLGPVYNGDVTIALGANPSGATMLGTTTVTMVNGVATFDDLVIDRPGDGYTLVASAVGAATRPDSSSPFTVCLHDCWIPRASMPTPRIDADMGAVSGLLYAVGGVDPHGVPSAAVEAYDPATNTWTPKASMPTARYGFGLGVVDGVLYAFGGITARGATAAVEAYDPAADRWSTRAPLAAPLAFPGAGVVNGVLYAVGGQKTDSTILATVQAYDPVSDRWTARASLRTPRSHVGIGVVNGFLYALDGLTTPVPTYTTVVPTVEAYDPVADHWSTRTPSGVGRLLPGVGVLPGNSILVVSGVDGVSYLSDTYVVAESYDPATDGWTRLRYTPFGTSLASVGEVNGVLYMVGYESFEYQP
jgi:hypothetical protein